jgi:hypothetical protein
MKYITTIIKKIISKETPIKPLGRWNLDYCDKKINNKIDMSNEDHCGPCGQYALSRFEMKHIQSFPEKNTEKDST